MTPQFERTDGRKHGSGSAHSSRDRRWLTGTRALQVALPLGGIGAGCVCLNGFGGLQDFSIRHKPSLTALPDGHGCSDAAFGVLHVKGPGSVTKLLEGPFPPERIFDQGLQAQGYRKGGHEGLPRFDRCAFTGEYPFGHVALRDPDVPLAVQITGWSPFIPLDSRHSSLPCAILEYTFRNSTRRRVDFEFSYHVSHLAVGATTGEKGTRNAPLSVPGACGAFFYNTEHPNAETFGSAALLLRLPSQSSIVNRQSAIVKAMWLRGPAWCYEAVSALWKEVSTGTFTGNDGNAHAPIDGRNGGSVLVRASLAPREVLTLPVVIAWHFPNCFVTAGRVEPKDKTGVPAGGCKPDDAPPPWHPFYAGQWQDARAVALYVQQRYESLRARTLAFKEALFCSTLPSCVLDAISANLGIMKSPTVLRQENGNLWGWEGCFCTGGCCHGTCTHVWNYAQSFPHLFPGLERTLREQELERSIQDDGYVKFRAALPDGPAPRDFHAAADGQLGGIMKVHRDWQISGDSAWLTRMYPLAKRSLDYCIRTWDPDHKGALFEPHHNTYDIEFWGPDGMCTSIYIGALSTLAKMARAAGHAEDAPFYEKLAKKGAAFMDRQLFNGEYYFQKVLYKGLRDKSFLEKLANPNDISAETLALLKKEGPKYQYGHGCLSDGVIGAWMARLYGIETPLSQANIRKSLRSIFRYNFRSDLSRHANTQRPGYAMGHEGGLILCTWPHGDKPTLPFIYSDETWTGIEYQVASHLILEGFVKEGLAIVEAARKRHDGRARNPWNEYECGNYYARAMASYALLQALSGFRYSAAEKTLWFAPRVKTRPFRTFFCTASGFGTITLERKELTIHLVAGELALNRLCVKDGRTPIEKTVSLNVAAGAKTRIAIR